MSGPLLPPAIAALEELRSSPARVEDLGASLRAVAASVEDVRAWAHQAAGPPGWEGEAARAAAGARTAFAGRTDTLAAALELAVVATTRLADRAGGLFVRRSELETERLDLDAAIVDAERRMGEGVLAGPAAVDVAARLHERAARLLAGIDDWRRDVADAEDACVAALAAAGTAADGRRTLAAAPLPDVHRLRGHLETLAGDAAAVAAWWRTLTVRQRQALQIGCPQVVGALEGIPVAGRDRANRARIAAQRDRLDREAARGPLSAHDAAALGNLDAVQQVIDDHADDVDATSGRRLLDVIEVGPSAYAGDGGSVVSLGDPDHAARVATYTPGFSTRGGHVDEVERIGDLRDEMLTHDPSVATVLAEDYDAPDLGDVHAPGDLLHAGRLGPALHDAAAVAGTAVAAAGGRRLADLLAGLEATRRHRDAQVTVVGHSYGSVLAAYAARDAAAHGTRDVDDVVLLANPGVPGRDVHDLVGDSGIRVYVGDDDHDPVSLLGRGPRGGPGALGTDPAAASYGADRIGERTGPVDVHGVLLMGNHRSRSYLGPGSEGLHNVGLVATGGDPALVPGRDAGNYQDLAALLGHTATGAVPGPLDDLALDRVLGAVDGVERLVDPDGGR